MSARELACIIGWPITHSLSPAIHNAAFAHLSLPWTYLAMPVRPGAAGEGVELLRTLGVVGANVTMPHKQTVMAFLDAVDDEAATIGAVNTIKREGQRLAGSNTDARGFVRFLHDDASIDLAGKRAVVLGGGGAARAVAYGLASAGAAVIVCARDAGQAASIADLHASIEAGSWDEVPGADLLIQATSAREGLSVEALPFGEQVVAVDLIYWAPETPFLTAARASGARAFDGLGMLIHQAALSFEAWTGLEAPIDAMRTAAAEAIRPT